MLFIYTNRVKIISKGYKIFFEANHFRRKQLLFNPDDKFLIHRQNNTCKVIGQELELFLYLAYGIFGDEVIKQNNFELALETEAM